AAMFFFPRGTEERGELGIEAAVELCHARGVPVIVDGAAQLPPKSNLWEFTRRGADAAIFSGGRGGRGAQQAGALARRAGGGRGLRGPQSTGLILGRRELVEACAFHGPPFPFIGRGMKVGKEELCGILAAVRWSLAQDEVAELAFYEAAVAEVLAAFEGHR